MRAPRIRRDGVGAAGGVAADTAFEFEKEKIGGSTLLQSTRSGEAGDAAADDDDVGCDRLARRGEIAGAQTMTRGR